MFQNTVLLHILPKYIRVTAIEVSITDIPIFSVFLTIEMALYIIDTQSAFILCQ